MLSLDGLHLWNRTGTETGERFGAALAAIISNGKDGRSVNFLVGAPGWQNQQGRAYYLTSDGELPLIISGDQPGAQFGAFVAAGPDLDGDGHPSLVIGEPGVLGPNGLPGRSTIFQPVARPRILTLRPLGNGRLELQFQKGAGVRIELEASADLINWETLTGVEASGAVDRFAITDASSQPRRFYRLVGR